MKNPPTAALSRGSPDQIIPGDEAYLRRDAVAGSMQVLSVLALRDNLGSWGPFAVREIRGIDAIVSLAGNGTLARVPLQKLTRDRPLGSEGDWLRSSLPSR